MNIKKLKTVEKISKKTMLSSFIMTTSILVVISIVITLMGFGTAYKYELDDEISTTIVDSNICIFRQ